jgi:hypothetical protein
MRLAGQTPAYVDKWLAGAAAELAKLAETPVATAVEESAESEQGELDVEPEAMS